MAQVLDALQAGQVDLTITNATPARAALVDFTRPVVALELGYLALAGSPVQDIAGVDLPGVRVGVTQGSSSQATLPLYEMAAGLPGARVLDGRWGLESLAIAIPKGRDAGRAALQSLADALQAEGAVQRAAERAGLHGTMAPELH